MKLGLVYVNSLTNKVLYMRHLISEYNLSVVAVCETWLVLAVFSSLLLLMVFRLCLVMDLTQLEGMNVICMLMIRCRLFALMSV